MAPSRNILRFHEGTHEAGPQRLDRVSDFFLLRASKLLHFLVSGGCNFYPTQNFAGNTLMYFKETRTPIQRTRIQLRVEPTTFQSGIGGMFHE